MASLDKDKNPHEGGDADLFGDISDIELTDFNKALEKLAQEDNEEVMAKLKTVDDPDRDIDAEIEALLKQESEAEPLPSEERDITFISDISVYHTVERANGVGKQKRNGKSNKKYVPLRLPGLKQEQSQALAHRVNAIPLKIFWILLAVVSVLLIVAIISLVLNMNIMHKQADFADKPGVASVAQPQRITNNANYIYVKQTQTLSGENVSLLKMVSDGLETVFYFDKPINMQNHSFTLTDQEGDIYPIDFSFAQGDTVDEADQTVLRFMPLAEGTTSYHLTIRDIFTGEAAEYAFTLDKPIVHAPARYVNAPIPLTTNMQGLSAEIYGAEFSTSGSRLYFGFISDDGSTIGRPGQDSAPPMIEMRETGGSIVIPLKKAPNLYAFPANGQILGRMDFAAIKNLTGSVNVNFKDLYKEIAVQKDVAVALLFQNRPETEITLPLGPYNVILERFGIQGNKCVLVLHSEDSQIVANGGAVMKNAAYAGRHEVRLDTELIITTPSGFQVVLPGQCKSKPIGTDITFDISDVKELIAAVPPEGYALRIQNAFFKLDDVTISIDLKAAQKDLSAERTYALASVRQAFEQRLAYKSATLGIGGIEGFAPELLQDTQLMRHYEPLPEAVGARYATEFIAYHMDGRSMNAVIAESWLSIVGNKETYFYRTHKITAAITENGWLVTGDEIIQ